MKMKLALPLLIVLVVLAGCGHQQSSAEEQPHETESTEQASLYVNEEFGLTIGEVPGWTLLKEVENPLNVSFVNEKSTIIVSILSNEKSIDEIKKEVLTGVGNVSIQEESENTLSFTSDRKESIRSHIKFERDSNSTKMIIFMTPAPQYEKNKVLFDEFQKNINFK
ncbi:hypothetical protein [Sporosarcina sp. UB5]|uniref:hypothetical protein n=1 Tax=Sporosarcina sp. UB5 TaxID=3047463 RepID=UPI003D7AB316